jgi:hypothetical protein
MGKPLDLVLSRLSNVSKNGTGFRAPCPAHGGNSANSLSIKEGNDSRVILHCFGGCEVSAILEKVGLTFGDLFADGNSANGKDPRVIIRTIEYEIRDLDGELRAIHVRKEFNTGPKVMKWKGVDGTWGLGNTKLIDLPFYGIHELGESPRVFVTEGEKARDALADLGISAVGTVTGAEATPSDEVLKSIIGLRILLWPDADGVGRDHMRRIARRLIALGQHEANIRIVGWKEAPAKGDAADFVATGATKNDIRELAANAMPCSTFLADAESGGESDVPVIRFRTGKQFGEQTPELTEWTIPGFAAVGGILKVDGPPKRGKTTLITFMMGAVLRGTEFLGLKVMQGPVVLLSEQGDSSLRESLARAGLLDRENLHIATYRDLANLTWTEVVAATFRHAVEIGAVLLVIDTFHQVSKVRGEDENSSGHALESIEPVQIGADLHKIAVVLTFHDRKGGGEVGESGRGSSAYAGAVDVIMHIDRAGGNFKPTIRKLEMLSRYDATPTDLFIELTPEGYVSLGNEKDIVTAMLGRTLREVLPEGQDDALTISGVKAKDGDEDSGERGLLELLADQGVRASRATLDAELNRWKVSGYVGRSGNGKRGDPYRFWLIAEPPESFLRSKDDRSSDDSNNPNDQKESKAEKVSSDASRSSEETNQESLRADFGDAQIWTCANCHVNPVPPGSGPYVLCDMCKEELAA